MRTSLALFLIAAAAPLTLHAQWACSSDGQPPVRAVVERFLSADCARCWSDPPTWEPADTALRVDWIVPSEHGDDAPLSAAATRDALLRWAAVGRQAPLTADTYVGELAPGFAHRSGASAAHWRIAHGPAINGYVGVGMDFVPARAAEATDFPFTATLLLVESVAPGAEGNPVARNVVRNAFQRIWEKREQLSKQEQMTWTDHRAMRVPDGAQTARLRLAGWVQDARGRIVAAVQSVCAP
jgi:hypothetical protein